MAWKRVSTYADMTHVAWERVSIAIEMTQYMFNVAVQHAPDSGENSPSRPESRL